MATELNYQQASRIRGESVGSLFADQLISGKGYKEGAKNVLSLKSKAMAKGFKEKFDPLNIAKVLTGGSRLGPALMGKILGRSKKDIEYFAGRAMPIFEKITKLSESESEDDGDGGDTEGNKKDNLKGIKTVLNKILTFLNKSYDKQVTLQEKENNFKESNKLDDDKRHNALLKALGVISSGNVEEEKKSKSLPDIFKKFRDKIKLAAREKIFKSAGQTAVNAAAQRAEKAAVETVAKTTGVDATAAAAEIAAQRATATAVAESVIGSAAKFTATKLIPGALLTSGVVSATKSAMDGDLLGAAYHMASGVVGTVPYFTLNPLAVGAGMTASTAIDFWSTFRQVYMETFNGHTPEKDYINLPSEQFDSRMKLITEVIKKVLGPSKKWDPQNNIPPDELPKAIEERTTRINELQTQINDPTTPEDKIKGLKIQLDAEEKRRSNLAKQASHNEKLQGMTGGDIDRIKNTPLPGEKSTAEPVDEKTVSLSTNTNLASSMNTNSNASLTPVNIENSQSSKIHTMDNINSIYSALHQSETDNKNLTFAQATTKNSQSKSNSNDVSVMNAPESAVKLPLDTLPVRHMDLQKTISSLTYA